MNTYICHFTAVKIGALGIAQNFARVIEAPDPDAARLKIYDTHEHVSAFECTLVEPDSPIALMRAKRAEYMDSYGQGDNWRAEGEELHHAYYSWLADFIGATERDLPVSRERILASSDPSFNDIPLKLWDDRHARVLTLARKAGVATGWALMETTCVLKAIARRVRDAHKAAAS